jgi:hypothetical protein
VNFKRVFTVAKLHGIDIVRRPVTLVLLAVLPVLIYFALGDDPYAVIVGGILMAFSIAGPAVFVLLTGRPVDQRLTLCGFKPQELIFGRLLLLNGLGFFVVGIFSLLVITQSTPKNSGYVVIGCVLVSLIAVPLGLALASIMPSDLEATLVMIGVVGVQVALRPQPGESTSPISMFLPLHGPRQFLLGANGAPFTVLTALLHSLACALILLIIATWALDRRCRIHAPDKAIAS